MNIPGDLKYTKDHEWVRVEGESVVIGITDFASQELGDIVFVEVETEGEALDREDTFGSIEAVKTVSDMFMPVSGEVTAFNESLEDAPETINEDPYGNGWIIKIAMSDLSELEDLLDATAYGDLVS